MKWHTLSRRKYWHEPSVVADIPSESNLPRVLADRSGLVVYANSAFLEVYQWTEGLIGSSLNRIIPTAFHNSHNMGFSRFLVTGKSRISNHVVEAAVVRGDGRKCWSKHLIVVEKIDNNYLIGAKIIPLDQAVAPSSSNESKPPFSSVIDDLRETIGKMEVALNEIEDSIVWTDGTGEVRWCNKAFDQLVGRNHLSILGSDLAELLPLKIAGVSAGHLVKELLAGEHNRREFEVEIQDRHEILEISCSEFSLRDSQKSIILALRIVTEQRRMADALAASRKRMEEELQIGREIQMSLLPPALPEEPEFSIFAICHPALEVGGDFYDHYFVRKNQLCFCVGDVSGKGVPAALFMAVVKTMIRNYAYGGGNRTAEIVHQANREINRHNPAGMFCSLFVCTLDIKSGLLTYTNAGHNPPFFKRGNISFEGVQFAAPRVVVSAVADDVRRFKGKAQQADDITMICLQHQGEGLNFL